MAAFLNRLALTGLASLLLSGAQSVSHKDYMVSIGTPAERVAAGSIWLYSYSWYGLQKVKLAAIKDGVAPLVSDAETLKRELDPHVETSGYVVAIQVGEHQWYRTPDIAPDELWSHLSSVVNSLGRVSTSATGEVQLILPALAKRRVTLLYLDGRAASDAKIDVSVYLWNTNHCAVHEGLPLGTFLTDKTGTIEVSAPNVALYLDGIDYYEPVGTGPAGRAYSHNFGLRTGPEEAVVLKEQWQFTDDDGMLEDAEVQVLTAKGHPRPNVDVWGSWTTNTCGGGDRFAGTDSKGIAHLDLDPSITGLKLMVGGPYGADDPKAEQNTRDLTSEELRELFSKHKLTVKW